MSIRIVPALRSAAFAGLLALAACSTQDANVSALDNELMANGADPALTSALEDQIMVDPNLVQQANPNSVRPPETPAQAQYPATGDGPELARAAAATQGAGGCAAAAQFDYGNQWASRLPAAFPSYPGGRITEAAGNDRGDCSMRVVTFTTADRADRVLDFYRNVAARGGYSAEHQQRGGDHILGGTNQGNDGAYYLIVTPAANGSEVALIVNNGR
jgi:hypothetical protein